MPYSTLKQVAVWLSITCLACTWAAGTWAAERSSPLNEIENEFHFVVLGDAQFHQPQRFNRLVTQSKKLDPAFVVQVGDLIEGYTNNLSQVEDEWLRFKGQIAPLTNTPYLPVPGNHDVFGGAKKPDARLEALYERNWGDLYFAHTYKNTLIIGLNSDSSEGMNQITGKQLRWLARTLENSQHQHKMIFVHRPPLLMKNGDDLHKLFVKAKVGHVFYGHHHHYHHFNKDGVNYTMTNAAANSVNTNPLVGGFHHLLQVSVRGNKVSLASIELDSIRSQDAVTPTDNYDFFTLSRNLVPKTISARLADTNRWQFTIPLNNKTDRALTAYITCSSKDLRWQFNPQQIPAQNLNPQSKASIKVSASFEFPVESTPQCAVSIPYQTNKGAWTEVSNTITIEIPKR